MKNIKILFLVSSLVGFLNASAMWRKAVQPSKSTFLHKFASTCDCARVKMSVPDMFDHDGIDPFLLDDNQQTARDIAIAKFEQTKKEYCDYVAWELEEYEKRYQEKIAQQKAEQK